MKRLDVTTMTTGQILIYQKRIREEQIEWRHLRSDYKGNDLEAYRTAVDELAHLALCAEDAYIELDRRENEKVHRM